MSYTSLPPPQACSHIVPADRDIAFESLRLVPRDGSLAHRFVELSFPPPAAPPSHLPFSGLVIWETRLGSADHPSSLAYKHPCSFLLG